MTISAQIKAAIKSPADDALEMLSKVLYDVANHKKVTLTMEEFLHMMTHSEVPYFSAFCTIKDEDKKKAETIGLFPDIVLTTKGEHFGNFYFKPHVTSKLNREDEVKEIDATKIFKNFKEVSLNDKQLTKLKEAKSHVISFRTTSSKVNEAVQMLRGENGNLLMSVNNFARLAFEKGYAVDKTAPYVLALFNKCIDQQRRLGINLNQITKEMHIQVLKNKVSIQEFNEATKIELELRQVLNDILFEIQANS